MTGYHHRRRLDALADRFTPGPVDDIVLREWLASLTDEDVELGATVAEHIKRHGTTAGLDTDTLERFNTLGRQWEIWKATHHEG